MDTAPNGRVLLETRDNVAVLTLNDPGVLNAFGFKLRADMTWALDRLESEGARCLMITGAGRAILFRSQSERSGPAAARSRRRGAGRGQERS